MNLAQFEDSFSAFCLRGPDERQRLGATENIATFSAIDPSAVAHDLEHARGLLDTLTSVQADPQTDPEGYINHRLYTLYLERFILETTLSYNGLTNYEQMPIAADRIGESVFTLLINDTRAEAARCEDLVERIKGFLPFSSRRR